MPTPQFSPIEKLYMAIDKIKSLQNEIWKYKDEEVRQMLFNERDRLKRAYIQAQSECVRMVRVGRTTISQ